MEAKSTRVSRKDLFRMKGHLLARLAQSRNTYIRYKEGLAKKKQRKKRKSERFDF